MYRGGLDARHALELHISAHFPDAAIMLERPVPTGMPGTESVGNAHDVGRILEMHHRGIVSVGYALRYLDAVKAMKRVIQDNGWTV
jgi:hypothetical protein